MKNEEKNFMLTKDGKAYVGDTVIDVSYKNEKIMIIGFFHNKMSHNQLFVAFNKGSPIKATGRSAFWDYELKENSKKEQ